MTTAKPQQMVGQTDSADDLIAELARLMAQDAPSEKAVPAPRPVPAQQAAPSSPIRIPGMQSPAPIVAGEVSPVPRFQFDPAPVAPAPVAAPVVPPQAQQKSAEPDPFNFDFGLTSARREPQPTRIEPAPRAAEPTPRPAMQQPAAPVIQPPIVQAPIMAAAPQPVPVEADAHDTIADLITAELNQSSAANQPAEPIQAAPVVQAPEPAPRPAPEAAVPLRPAAALASRPDHVEPARPALRPVNLTPIARPESDKFRIAPVFGLGTNPPAAANSAEPVRSEVRPVEPQAQMVAPVASPEVRQEPVAVAPPVASTDPIEDIESLIGRAVRVNVGQATEPPAPSPALRSLATPTLAEPPKVASDRMVASADEAILAAAAATGAEVGWVNPADARPSRKAAKPEKQAKVKAPKAASSGLMRAFLGPVVAICLLLVAGFGLYWVLGLGGASGPAPVLVADTSPIKQVAAAQPDATQAQQSVVFNEIDGVEPGANEELVSRDQADVNEVTRIVTPPDVNADGVANRKVRTVTVRPDGSIVSGDDAVAGAAMLPVDRPSVPAVPGAQTASPELLAAASATQTPAAPVAPVTPSVIPVVPGSNVSVVDAAGNAIAGRTAPVPFQRPASIGNAAPSQPSPVNAVVDPVGAILQPVSQTTVQASTGQSPQLAPAPAAVAAPVAAPVTNAAAYAQLASQRSEADAQATLDILNRRYGLLFNGSQLQIQRADLGERGIYYRVLLPTNSRELAADLCTSVKSNGDDCLVM